MDTSGCSTKNLIYYLNNNKIDLAKTYFGVSKLSDVAFVNYEKTKALLGDTTNGCLVAISSKQRIRFLSLEKFLRKNNIIYSTLVNTIIKIDGEEVKDASVLVDSKARISKHNRTTASNDIEPPVQKNYVLLTISTNSQK